MDIEEYYNDVTGFKPYSYQKDVFKSLIDGENIILNVPTGAGKTWASVLPFFYAKEMEIDFPQKMIYSLPLRTLVNSIHEDVKENRYIKGKFQNINKQTGEYSNDSLFEGDAVFSTIDQTLSNFLSFPLSLSPNQANINAGALIGSYLIFDEFHLLDSDLAMATTIGSLKKMGELCRCCIMTATLSKHFRETLTQYLPNYKIITLDDYPNDRAKVKSLLPAQNKKTVSVVKRDGIIQPLKANCIIEQHNAIKEGHKRTIVICNRVEKAQQIFCDIKEVKEKGKLPEQTTIICLHSRLFEEDRKSKEGQLKKLFGKGSKANAILISTQVIEAGMDISCEALHTEISPIDSFLQRAGRCARFEDEIGKIFVYSILEEDVLIEEGLSKEEQKTVTSKYRQYLPYDAELSEKTLEALQNYTTLDGDNPKQLIETVLNEYDKQIMARLQSVDFNREIINKSWNECKKDNYRNTIRDIQSTELILMLPEDEAKFIAFPYSYQSISLFRFSFQKWFKDLYEQHRDRDWIAKKIILSKDDNMDMGNQMEYTFREIHSVKEIDDLVFLNANYFKYEKDFGLTLTQGYKQSSPLKEKNKKELSKEYVLTKDSFVAHSLGLYRYYLHDFRPNLAYTFKVINRFLKLSLSDKDFDELFKLMFAYHDLGKLNKDWQKPMREYQAAKDLKFLNEFTDILAHTDYDKRKQADLDLKKKYKLVKRPPHASIGAYAIQPVLDAKYGNDYLTYAVSFAIYRHHSAGNTQARCSAYQIPEKYYNAFKDLINKMDLVLYESPLNLKNEQPIEIENEDEMWLLYFFFVRILRLCDQRATEDLEKYSPMKL